MPDSTTDSEFSERDVDAEARSESQPANETRGGAPSESQAPRSGPGPRPAPPKRPENKYRKALDIFNQARNIMVEALADEILENEDDYRDAGFLFQEFLESRGPRMQFVSVIAGYLEHAAETFDERWSAAVPAHSRRRRRGRAADNEVETSRASDGTDEV